ncbi:TVP38/TMEM64 family protein [Scenedesmus sp. PABB004]|nr:TVP38/TMEM64 family protein [Scenedesmus sp. PABB004]
MRPPPARHPAAAAALPTERRGEPDAPAAGGSGGDGEAQPLVHRAEPAAPGGGGGGGRERARELEGVIAASGALGYVIFAAAYAAATVLLFPASVLTLGAGYLFGPLKGTALVSGSATLGACLALPRVRRVVDRVSTRDGAQLVALLRLSPLVPFGLLNYALGITGVSFPAYAAASWAGMLPGTFAYVYLGSLGRVAADAAAADGAGGAGGGFDGIRVALYVLGAAATLGATKLISNAAAAALGDDEAGGGEAGGGKGG